MYETHRFRCVVRQSHACLMTRREWRYRHARYFNELPYIVYIIIKLLKLARDNTILNRVCKKKKNDVFKIGGRPVGDGEWRDFATLLFT